MNPKERKNKMKNKRKMYDSLKNLFSSLAITVGAVVIAATYIPKSPKASILDLTVFEHEVIYQVQVTDEDEALLKNSLKIVLDNQFETYTYTLELGVNSGIFENLTPNTTYQLSIYASKGFGDERLTSQKLKTNPSPGGAIVSYQMIEETEFDYTYDIRVLIPSIFEDYTSVRLYYGYKYLDEELEFYDYVDITSYNQIVTLSQISNYATHVYLYLEGVKENQEIIILDELSFPLPLYIEPYIYLESLTKSKIAYSFYASDGLGDITYQAYLYKDDRLIKKIDIKSDGNSPHTEGTLLVFDQLSSNTSYDIKISAHYQDPYTLRFEKIIVYEEKVKTLGDYQIDSQVIEYDEYFEVTILVSDPHHYFQIPYYILYDTSIEFPVYLESENYSFTPGDPYKSVTFIIYKPLVESYELIIGIRHQNDFYINHVIHKKTYTP